ncbi:hypothetical protein BpHYR1_011177 [Brachionus plicatilis]|uniref:Uncharacterized protein n=1 Tax=Brachionus plicatilis TaxID=10195 RepID=A0A3M7QVP8_BRAPC|nr:hypothetical protein BpHYR1_011177 [Brachionus plicatilis]
MVKSKLELICSKCGRNYKLSVWFKKLKKSAFLQKAYEIEKVSYQNPKPSKMAILETGWLWHTRFSVSLVSNGFDIRSITKEPNRIG